MLPSLVASTVSVGLALVQFCSAWMCESPQPAALSSVNASHWQPDDHDSAAEKHAHAARHSSRTECRDEVADCYVEMREDSARQ